MYWGRNYTILSKRSSAALSSGSGIATMAYTFDLSGAMPAGAMVLPMYSTSEVQNCVLCCLNVTCCSRALLHHSLQYVIVLCIRFGSYNKVISDHVHSSDVSIGLLLILCIISLADRMPNNMQQKLTPPHSELNLQKCGALSGNFTCQ